MVKKRIIKIGIVFTFLLAMMGVTTYATTVTQVEETRK